MSSARSRKFRDDFNDRLDRAREAKNPRIKNSIYGEYPQQQPLRTSGAIGSWKGFANEQEKNEYMQGMMRFFNELPIQQDVLREQRERIVRYNNFTLGDDIWNFPPERRERNEAPQWEVNFTPDPTVRFENLDVPVAPKEPDICDIINLDD
jgi:hypothetical protein